MLSERGRKVLREAVILGLLIGGILAGRSTLADHYYVPSGSMLETLQIGDRVFVDKRAYGVRVPFTSIELTRGDAVARGDIVIFDSPEDGTRLIKRIVATGGDEVLVQNGHLRVNGKWLQAPDDPTVEIIGDKRAQLNLRDGGGPDFHAVLGDDMVLAVGDHRGLSHDGRRYGPVAESEIYGRAVAVYYRRGDGFTWRAL